jgi:hypothetical protein
MARVEPGPGRAAVFPTSARGRSADASVHELALPRGMLGGVQLAQLRRDAASLQRRALTPPRERVQLTAAPIRVTATGAQELRLALDVLAFDMLDLELRVLDIEGTTPSITIIVQTGMQRATEEGWVTASTFVAVTSAPASQIRTVQNMLRYVRWNVSALTGTGGPAATFLIYGVGRRWG